MPLMGLGSCMSVSDGSPIIIIFVWTPSNSACNSYCCMVWNVSKFCDSLLIKEGIKYWFNHTFIIYRPIHAGDDDPVRVRWSFAQGGGSGLNNHVKTSYARWNTMLITLVTNPSYQPLLPTFATNPCYKLLQATLPTNPCYELLLRTLATNPCYEPLLQSLATKPCNKPSLQTLAMNPC